MHINSPMPFWCQRCGQPLNEEMVHVEVDSLGKEGKGRDIVFVHLRCSYCTWELRINAGSFYDWTREEISANG